MKINRKIGAVTAAAAALLALSGCQTGFRSNVTRFQQLPAPTGQTFTIVADNPRLNGGLEFGEYAAHVSRKLSENGFKPIANRAEAQLIVHMDYEVDRGRERIQSTGFIDDPFWSGPYGYGWGGWRGGFYGRRFYPGFYDPFLFGPGFGGGVRSYTVYTSELRLRIDRANGGGRLFEGTARAQSLSNRLTYLVPNLIEAMFKDFPGYSGETIKVTIAPEPRGNRR